MDTSLEELVRRRTRPRARARARAPAREAACIEGAQLGTRLTEATVALLAVCLGARVSFTYARTGMGLTVHLQLVKDPPTAPAARLMVWVDITNESGDPICEAAARVLGRTPVQGNDAAATVDRLMEGCTAFDIEQPETNFYYQRTLE